MFAYIYHTQRKGKEVKKIDEYSVKGKKVKYILSTLKFVLTKYLFDKHSKVNLCHNHVYYWKDKTSSEIIHIWTDFALLGVKTVQKSGPQWARG